MPPGHNMTLAAARRRDPLVRLVRVQPRQHALGDGLRGHRPGRHQHDARRVCRCARRGALGLPPVEEVGRRHHINGLLAGLVAITVSVLLGVALRFDRHRRHRRRDHGPRRSTSPSGSGSTTRCGAFAVHGVCGIWGTLEPRVVRHRQLRRPGVRRQGPLLRRQRQPAGRPGRGQRDRSSRCTLGRRSAADVRHQGHRRAADLRGRASSRVSTSPSTVRRRTTPSTPTMGYSPIPSNMEGVAPGLSAPTVPPSDIHLPTSD